jgi:mRNA interferase HigB
LTLLHEVTTGYHIGNGVSVVAFALLRRFIENGHSDGEKAFRQWYRAAEKAQWNSLQDVRRDFGTVDLVGGDKLVFNIGGNKYRLVTLVHFGRPTLFVLWVGTHAEYDRIDVKKL